MKIGVICCRVLEREVRAVVKDCPDIHSVTVMDWGLHIRPELLRQRIEESIRAIADQVDAVLLGYGRCQAMDQLPDNLPVPVFRPPAEDCIGVLLGQERYDAFLEAEAGTWFLTPGWTEMGMEFVFQELQLDKMIEKWAAKGREQKHDPLALAHRMLKDYTKALLIDTGEGDRKALKQKALAITEEFGWRLEEAPGSLGLLQQTLARARTRPERT